MVSRSEPKQGEHPVEGIYTSEELAIKACIADDYYIMPVETDRVFDAVATTSNVEYFWWVRLQTKEEAIRRKIEAT
jgi:hypothetical protein